MQKKSTGQEATLEKRKPKKLFTGLHFMITGLGEDVSDDLLSYESHVSVCVCVCVTYPIVMAASCTIAGRQFQRKCGADEPNTSMLVCIALPDLSSHFLDHKIPPILVIADKYHRTSKYLQAG